MAKLKPKFPCITEPNEGLVHYQADPLSGNVTLCGRTDFIGFEQGQPTDDPCTCTGCIAIFNWCSKYRENADICC